MNRYSILLTVCLMVPYANATEFGDESLVFQGSDQLQFSINTSGTLAVDTLGNVHLVYFDADEAHRPPENRIWYQTITEEAITSPVRVDHGNTSGGRHPSLAIDKDNTVHVVWQDYRHTTATGNYIDNLEIYSNRKSIFGSFLETDLRISETHANHLGDNGYVPNVAVGTDGKIHIAWYDFTWNGNNADVYLRTSTAEGEFPPQMGIEELRITTSDEDFMNYTSNWMPDVCALPDSSLYVVWGFLRGWQGAFHLQGRSISADGILGAIEQIADQSGRFIDPPRLASDRSGNLGLVSSSSVNGQYEVCFQYKPSGGTWSSVLRVNDGMFGSSQPSIAFDSSGNAYVVWQENWGGFYQVALAKIVPRSMSVEERMILSREEADARTPAIALDPVQDQIHIVWIDHWDEGQRSIIHRREKTTSISDWILH